MGLNNIVLVEVLNAPACDPDWFVCKALPNPYPLILFSGNQEILTHAQHLFEQALRLVPDSDSLRLHLAETAFSQMEREDAARLVADLSEPLIIQSPLLVDDRFESRLVRAKIESMRQNWAGAVENYRLGLAWGDERTLPRDEIDYLKALASLEKEYLLTSPEDAQTIYRIGKYLAEAGEWEEAETWLLKTRQEKNFSRLSSKQAAWVMVYLGKIAELQSDFALARSSYRKAIELAPELRQPYLYLIDLLCMDQLKREQAALEEQLLAMGPSYHLGAQGEGYQAFEPLTLENGWTMVGYDLDEEMLEQTKNLELVLWWKSQGRQPVGEGWMQVGDYWLQRQVVTNLFPNAGFEWGVDERGIPLGHDRELYGRSRGSLTVEAVEVNENRTQVASANNSKSIRNVALVSKEIPVKDNGYYLMSGWVRDQGRSATIGRSCTGFPPNPISPYFIFGYQGQPLGKWIHYANVSMTQPDFRPTVCELLIMNNDNSDKSAYWDNNVFIRLNIVE